MPNDYPPIWGIFYLWIGMPDENRSGSTMRRREQAQRRSSRHACPAGIYAQGILSCQMIIPPIWGDFYLWVWGYIINYSNSCFHHI